MGAVVRFAVVFYLVTHGVPVSGDVDILEMLPLNLSIAKGDTVWFGGKPRAASCSMTC